MVGVGMLLYSFVACFICIDQSLLEWQITNFILQAVGLEGFEGDEQGLNMLAVLCGIIYPFAVLCGIIYPFIGIGCLFTGLGIINKSAARKESFIN